MKAAKPLQKRLQKYVNEYTSGIDLKNAEKDKLVITEKKNILEKTKEYFEEIKDGENTKEIERVKKRLTEQENELKVLREKFNSNKDYLEKYELFNSGVNEAFGSLIIDDEIIIPFLKEYLIGDFDKINFEDMDLLRFVSEVLTDFFLLLNQNQAKLKNSQN